MNSKLTLAGIVIIIVIATGGFLFWNMNKSTTNVPEQSVNPTSNSEPQTTTVISTTMSQSEITVEGGEFKFTPNKVTVKKGEKVKLTFKNTGKFPHDYVISDLDVATKRINPGESDTVEFTTSQAGEFKIICSVGNHEEQGMTGILTVEE